MGQKPTPIEGPTPLDVLIEAMKYNHKRASESMQVGDYVSFEKYIERAQMAATALLPYRHPKLTEGHNSTDAPK